MVCRTQHHRRPTPGSEADRFVKALFTPTAAVRKRAQEMALAAPLGDQ
jgi:hypothetical protein